MVRVEKQQWGSVDGKTVHLFHIWNTSGMKLSVSDYGGVIQSWIVTKPDGGKIDIVLGYDTLREYIAGETFFGAAVGPIADRLAGGKCEISGKTLQFPLNAGPDCMHSGSNGFHSRIWNWEILENGLALSYAYSPEENPLQANLQVSIRYLADENNGFCIEYAAKADRETLLSLTNHSYFTLSGGQTDCRNDLLTVHADVYARTMRESDPICTGETCSVEHTPMDLRCGVRIGDVLAQDAFPEIRTAGGIDHYFPVNGSGMREHARLYSPENGMTLVCQSDAPGVLIYTANGLERELGKGGLVYGKNYAVCMETECFPNGANFPQHRSQVLLPAGETFASCTGYRILF